MDFKTAPDWLLEKWANYQLDEARKKLNEKYTEPNRKSGIFHDTCNLYCYGDLIKAVYFSAPHKVSGYEERGKTPSRGEKTKNSANVETGERFKQSVARAKRRIFELAICNEFQFFCTFTQDEKKRDRFDLKEFRKDFAQFVRNLNRGRTEDEKIKYLLIPEKHKNGAWHMHGLLKGLTDKDLRKFSLEETLPYRIRNAIKSGETVYNWETYSRKFGYFTCTEIKNLSACSRYITKYVTKDMQSNNLEAGAHLFFASQGLKSKEILLYHYDGKLQIGDWDFENKYVKIKEFRLDDIEDINISVDNLRIVERGGKNA